MEKTNKSYFLAYILEGRFKVGPLCASVLQVKVLLVSQKQDARMVPVTVIKEELALTLCLLSPSHLAQAFASISLIC